MKRRALLNTFGGLLLALGTTTLSGCGGGGGGNENNGGDGQPSGAIGFAELNSAITKVDEIVAHYTFGTDPAADAMRLAQTIGMLEQVDRVYVGENNRSIDIHFKNGPIYNKLIRASGEYEILDLRAEHSSPGPTPRVSAQKHPSSGRSIPEGKRAFVLSGFSHPDWKIGGKTCLADAVSLLLTQAGYDVTASDSSVDILGALGDCDVLYMSGHGASDRFWRKDLTQAILDGFSTYRSRITVSNEYSETQYRDLVGRFNMASGDAEAEVIVSESEYGDEKRKEFSVTQHFIRNRMRSLNLGVNSLIYIDGCGLNSDASAEFRQAFLDRGGSVYAGWNERVQTRHAHLVGCWLFDRMSGANRFVPKGNWTANDPVVHRFDLQSPPLRPFDLPSLKEYMRQSNPRMDRYNYDFRGERWESEFVFASNPTVLKALDEVAEVSEFALLSPSIQAMSVSGSSVYMWGRFGNKPGTVVGRDFVSLPRESEPFVQWYDLKEKDGTYLSNVAALIPQDYSGPIHVEVDGRRSNTRMITRWKGRFILLYGREPALHYEVVMDTVLVGDVGTVRDVPMDLPFPSGVGSARATTSSIFTVTAGGVGASDAGSVTWSGGTGPTKFVETIPEGVEHDEAYCTLYMHFALGEAVGTGSTKVPCALRLRAPQAFLATDAYGDAEPFPIDGEFRFDVIVDQTLSVLKGESGLRDSRDSAVPNATISWGMIQADNPPEPTAARSVIKA